MGWSEQNIAALPHRNVARVLHDAEQVVWRAERFKAEIGFGICLPA